MLMIRGSTRADAALVNPQGFNGELEGIVLCVVEETDLTGNKLAYRRIKDWVTGREMLIHPKRITPYNAPNISHWIQCDNDPRACPVFPGDTRITVFQVKGLDPINLIPKNDLLHMMEKEAADFLTAMMRIEIPPSRDRLNVPVVSSDSKKFIQITNQTQLEAFMTEKCKYTPGAMIKFSEFYEQFIYWLEESERDKWSRVKVSRGLPSQYLRGRQHSDAQHYIGNIGWVDGSTPIYGREVVKNGDFLDILA